MQQMPKQRQAFILTLGHIFLKKRWLVFVIGALIVTVTETTEHWPITIGLYKHFLYELFFYGILVPFIIWGLLTMLARALAADVPVAQIQAEATRTERQRIARDLHDQLAQNIGYLHFKLDQLATSGEATLFDIKSIQMDLEQMRQIANQAYGQVRDTLDSLRTESEMPDDLAFALQQQAQAVAGRTNLDIKVDYQDNVKPLCPLVKHAIVNIAREALTNVTKHAQASQVIISLACNEVDAFLTIADNGKGFEVDDNLTAAGHYGLEIMRERAEEVGGILSVESAPGQGMQLVAEFPNTVVSRPLLQKCDLFRCEHLIKTCQDENSFS